MAKKIKKRFKVLIDPKYSEEYYVNGYSVVEVKEKAWKKYLKKANRKSSVRIMVDKIADLNY